MSIHFQDDSVTLHHGDCLDVLRTLPDASVDSVVTDPPYGLGFMGKEWDSPGRAARATTTGIDTRANPRGRMGVEYGGASYGTDAAVSGRAFQQWCELWAVECLRVLKPGGHLLAFGGTRTWHRLACAVEDAGFEVRDSIAWLYGSGFPKSLDVSKAIDKAAGAEREVVGPSLRHVSGKPEQRTEGLNGSGTFAESVGMGAFITAPATPDAAHWQGWGTALKPSHEPVCVAVKPYSDRDILAEIGSHITRLEDECRRSASGAARCSAPTPADSPEARTATAPASAATQPEGAQAPKTQTGVAAGSFAAMDTSASESTGETCSSTVTSWKACWAELCELTSTSTTSTTTEATTDLRTLWSSISSLTVTSTPGSPTPRLTSPSIASAVDSLFAATVLRLHATLALSAPESATASTPTSRRGAGGSSTAFEPVVVARKPLVGTVAANVLEHGTGALNIDGCRVETTDDLNGGAYAKVGNRSESASLHAGSGMNVPGATTGKEYVAPAGRWPANVVLDESQAAELDEQSGQLASGDNCTRTKVGSFLEHGGLGKPGDVQTTYGDSGGASRFFYVAKADASERPRVNGTAHPTVKPLALMRWLVRLVTPPGGTVLEPFAGSGTTVEACILEGFHCIAIEKGAEYLPLIESRIARRRDPVRAVELSGDDAGLFGFIDGEEAS